MRKVYNKIIKQHKLIAQMSTKENVKMNTYTIKGIVRKDNEKATLKYLRGSKEVTVDRAIYEVDGAHEILFKGIKLGVKFNAQGIAVNVVAKEVYDEIIKKKEGNERLQYFKFELEPTMIETVEVKKELIIPQVEVVKTQKAGEVKHYEFEWIKLNVELGNPVYLYGPAGSGKNHVLQQVAEELGLKFYFTNSVQQEYKITGFIDAGGVFHETEFYKAWVNGGLFFLDEMDASIPEVLTLLNAALANGYFNFDNVGKVDAHPDFRVVAAGNTVGTGADEQYVGRMQLDQATLDRFLFIEFDYDRNIELAIAKGNEELVNFVRDLRKQAKKEGINTTFSYRCITMVVKLEGKADLPKILKSAVVKGLDKDTLNTIQTNPSNKYSKALWVLKQSM
jgi:cobaltochelatase CobS